MVAHILPSTHEFFKRAGLPHPKDREQWEPVYYELRDYAWLYCSGLGVSEVCRMRKLNRAVTARVLSDTGTPKPSFLPKLCAVLGWSPEQLREWRSQ